MYAPSGLLRGGVPKGRSRTARPSSLSSFKLPDNSFPPLRHRLLLCALEVGTAPFREQPRASYRKKEGPETYRRGDSGSYPRMGSCRNCMVSSLG
jgi:hypothetical protein